MSTGWAGRFASLTLTFCLVFSAAYAQVPKPPSPGVKAAPRVTLTKPTASKTLKAVTVVSVDDQAAHLTLANGTALDADLRPSSLFVKDGQIADASAFPAGAKALARTRVSHTDGAVSLVMLCDPASAAAIDAYRRKPLVGTVQSAEEGYWVIKADGGATPVTLRVTAKTVYRKNGAEATAEAFPAGASVAIITRGLPNGMLMASIIADKSAEATAEKAARKIVIVSGLALDVQVSQNTLAILGKRKTRRTVAVTDATHIKVRKQEAAFNDIKDGMRVQARLGHEKDAQGNAIATSLSAYDAAPPKNKKAAPIGAAQKTP